MKLLLVSEPGEALKFRSLHMVSLVKIDVRIERDRTGCCDDKEKIEWENKEHQSSDENGGDKEVGGVVSFIVLIFGRHQMTPRVVGMVKSDVISEEDTAKPMMTEAVVQ